MPFTVGLNFLCVEPNLVFWTHFGMRGLIVLKPNHVSGIMFGQVLGVHLQVIYMQLNQGANWNIKWLLGWHTLIFKVCMMTLLFLISSIKGRTSLGKHGIGNLGKILIHKLIFLVVVLILMLRTNSLNNLVWTSICQLRPQRQYKILKMYVLNAQCTQRISRPYVSVDVIGNCIKSFHTGRLVDQMTYL